MFRDEDHPVESLQPGGFSMNTSLRNIAIPFVCVVIAAVVPVLLAAFLTIPFNLGGHLGDERSAEVTVGRHMT